MRTERVAICYDRHFDGVMPSLARNGELPNLSVDPELIIADVDLGALSGPDPSGWDLPRDLRPDIYSPR